MADQAAIAPMSKTEKQRRDLAYVAQALRDAERPQEAAHYPDEGDAPQNEPQAPPGPAVVPAGEKIDPAEQAALGVPAWFKWPAGYQIPEDRRGTPATFLRLPPWLTGRPQLGERQCMLLVLSPAESKLARTRVPDKDNHQTVAELAKQMVRVVDGHPAEFFRKGPGSVHEFWKEIGPKAQDAIETLYVKMHVMNAEERADFLQSCIETRSVA